MAKEEEERREEESEERGTEEKGKPYTYEFYHEIGKKGGRKGGETTKRKHGHETLEEHRKEHGEA
ncbi:MAG: hypothetical protein OIN66_06175 [Candidatus Methanoperedens sp.]|nr:hypothetical protein [Candidatus Methanoperedens sp.]